jgi:(p)ppGpp synthase/HD superfamily hydrolase
MSTHGLTSVATAPELDPRDQALLRELQVPEAAIPVRSRQVCAQLRAWGLPGDLAQVGLLMRRIERSVLRPDQLAPFVGPVAVATAGALAAFGGSVPRPALQNVEPIWKLFMLAYFNPSASVLKITELLMRLRHGQDAGADISAATIRAAAAICARLGMWDVRIELLDAQARLLDPRLVAHVRDLQRRSEPVRAQFFATLQHELGALLRAQGIAARIERRPRPLYRLIDEGLDSLRGASPWADVVVILIDDVQDCYRALGAINHTYPVAGAKLRDYIGGPKENGYQAIHTTVEYPAPPGAERIIEVEIRIMTPAMDRYNREGYLIYLAGRIAPARWPEWWDARQRWLDAYQGRSAEMFVFTPDGETIFLPRGATVLDFAVRIHSDLGVYCRGALVNGHHAMPGESLACADICEVLIDQHGTPIDRRVLDRASTTSAKARIRHVLQKGSAGAARGQQIFREMLAKRLAEQEVRTDETTIEQQVAAICQARGYRTVDALYRAIARGEFAPDRAIGAIVDQLLVPRIVVESLPAEMRAHASRISLALCCRPRPSQPAVALPVHQGHQLRVHDATCRNVTKMAYPVAWQPVEEQAYIADVLYEGWDRPGLIHQVTGAIAQVGTINIRSFHADVPEPSLARIRFSFEASSKEQIEQVRSALERMPEQRHVDVHTVTVIDEGFRITMPLTNPYSLQPVGQRPLFVGRNKEVSLILEWLSGAGHILIRGPKRIGKSSLLEHLARYHLGNFKTPPVLNLQGLPTDELYFPHLLGRLAALIARQAGPRAPATPLDAQAIARDPIGAFALFLSTVRRHSESDRFVVLIDELGVVLSRMQGSTAGYEFFDQWRTLLNDATISQHLSFIVALPDYTLERIDAANTQRHGDWFSLRLGELGLPIRLTVLDENAARELITTPIRLHLAYQPDDLALLLRETGGHPFYIHLVCGQIITAVQVQQRKIGLRTGERQEVRPELVRSALEAVSCNEDAFHHVLADSTPGTRAVLGMVAALTSETEPLISRSRLGSRLRRRGLGAGEAAVARALEERPDLLFQVDDQVGIRAALVARWLRSRT